MKTRRCDEGDAEGRLAKAEQFLDAAETVRDFANDEADVGDAFVTLCVHAGIAAADMLCCVALGEHAQDDDHAHAVGLLARVAPEGRDMSRSLRALLGLKTKAGYSARAVSVEDRKRALRNAQKLVIAARDRA